MRKTVDQTRAGDRTRNYDPRITSSISPVPWRVPQSRTLHFSGVSKSSCKPFSPAVTLPFLRPGETTVAQKTINWSVGLQEARNKARKSRPSSWAR